MADIYRIAIEDEVTGNAYRIAGALADVSAAAHQVKRAIGSMDQEVRVAAAEAMHMAQVELRAARAAKSAGDAIARLGPKVQTTTTAKVGATQQTFKFSYALNALASSAMSAAFSIANRLGSALVDVGKSLFETADLATRAHLSFKNFFGNEGDKTLEESIAIAKRYGFTIEDTIKQVQRFGAAGFNPEQSKGLLRFGADMMAAGRTVQDVKGIFLAMTQIQGKGKLQAEELTQQLAERGINAGKVWEILARKFKTNKDNVMAMQKAGKIGPGAALNAIVEAGVKGVHGSKIGQAGEQIADATVGGLERRMGTLIEEAVFGAVDEANPALVKGMQSIFSGMGMADTKSLQDNLTNTLQGVGKVLEEIGPKIPAMVDGFTKAFGAAAGFKADSFKAFADALPDAAKNLGMIAGFMVQIADATVKIAAFLGKTGTEQTELDPVQRFLHEKLFKKTAGLVNEQDQAKYAADVASRKAADEAIGEDAAQGYANGWTTNAPTVGHAVREVAKTGIDALKEENKSHSPSRVFMDLGGYAAQGYALGIDSDADLAMHSTKMMADGAIAAGAGATGLDSRRGTAAGSAAGDAISSRSSALSVRVGDVLVGGGGSAGSDAGEAVRSYFETEFVSMLERHLEGCGA